MSTNAKVGLPGSGYSERNQSIVEVRLIEIGSLRGGQPVPNRIFRKCERRSRVVEGSDLLMGAGAGSRWRRRLIFKQGRSGKFGR